MGHQELRVPPQNVEAEKSVLGSMLIDNEAIGLVIEILDESWFYEEAHRISMPLSFIFTIIIKCRYHHGFGSLKNRGLRSREGSHLFIRNYRFCPHVGQCGTLRPYCQRKGILRKLIRNATQIVSEGYESKRM